MYVPWQLYVMHCIEIRSAITRYMHPYTHSLHSHLYLVHSILLFSFPQLKSFNPFPFLSHHSLTCFFNTQFPNY
ncbi:hypothetical protein RJT34_13076 [Clitoria ternatea]|uniref:Uncharacterized protein n=1 Tax=Clitoria ternatea TaxID=43366 RepID=A0AAN9PLH8_CLITE